MKKLIMTIAIATMLAAPAMAQVFLDDDAMNANRNPQAGGPGAYVPEQNVTHDQYVPVGEGMMLLAGLAGAYLVGKRRKEE